MVGAVLLPVSLLVGAFVTRGDATVRHLPDCDATAAHDLSGGSWLGDLEGSQGKCLLLSMASGEFARLSVSADSGHFQAIVLPPGDTFPTLRIEVWGGEENALSLAWEAAQSATYRVVLQAMLGGYQSEAKGVEVALEEHQSATLRQAHREELEADPRVRWLADNAIAVRSISPTDTDFSDLEPLRDALAGVRMVLLGEAHHGDGSDLLAKGRLVRFLHEEMGFDVLAFESGLYGVAKTWQALKSGEPPHDAFLQGVYRVWTSSEQVQPLIDYVGAAARTENPLELAGFDGEFTGSAAPETLVNELTEFLGAHGLTDLPVELEGGKGDLLQAVLELRFYSDPASLPDSIGQVGFIRLLREMARDIETAVDSREAKFWSQTLRSLAIQARALFDGAAGRETEVSRDRQMAENLVWLADEYFPGRRIIVWAAAGHVMRKPTLLEVDVWADYLMGDGVWEALGEESYVVGFSSYEGSYRWINDPSLPAWDIIPDQRPAAEFEELMVAAGHEFAFVDLRAARRSGSWLGESFLARPMLYSWTSRWSESMDAIFFIRTQEPSRPISVEQVEVEIAPEVFDQYVGEYELDPDLVITVTRDGDRFYLQATGQQRVELFAASETDFFVRIYEASVTFGRDDADGPVTHMILHWGRVQRLERRR